jgi:hypothetical protein
MLYDPNMLQSKGSNNIDFAQTQTMSDISEIDQKKVTSLAEEEACIRSVDRPRFQPFYACSREWSLMLEPDANIAVSEVTLPQTNAGSVLTLESRTGQDLSVNVDIKTHVATFAVSKTAQPHKRWIIRLAPGISKQWTSKPVTMKLQAPSADQQIISFEREVSQCDIKFVNTPASTQQSRSEIDTLPKKDF